MAKYVSYGDTQEDIRHYQKRLIPLNIVVCVMCLVSIFTLMFAPILRIDVAKIISSTEVSSYIKETVLGSLNGGNNGQSGVDDSSNPVFALVADGDFNDSSSSGAGISDEMITAISTSVVDPLLQSIGKSDISLSLTAFSSMKVLMGGSEALKGELSGMIVKFTDGLIDAINNLFKDGAIVNTIVEVSLPTVIKASVDNIKNNPETPQEVIETLNSLSEAEINQLCEDLKDLQTTKTPEQFIDKIVEISPKLMLTLTGEELDKEQTDAVREEIAKMVYETVEKVQEQEPGKTFDYNLEAFICIQFSQSIDITELDKLIEQAIGGENNDNSPSGSLSPSSRLVVTDEDANTPEEKDNTIYTSFSDILGSMENTQANMGDAISAAVDRALDGLGESIDLFAQIYGMLFVFIAVFIVLWLILFLFAFFHIFAKNKRFTMWYVKLLCWIPGMIWLVLTLASMPAVITAIAGAASIDLPVSVITALLKGISSWGTGVSFICYLLLWPISIFWAFPIKHKIRKLKKQAKREQKGYYSN